jgi:hypothetical protein
VKGLSHAEIILKELGITDPGEIDLEAIAWTLGVRVKYRPLDGCEARIIGNGNQAIITVNSRSFPQRQRFSLAHELGHWNHHRGHLLVCQADEIGSGDNKRFPAERVADTYAADILMPRYIFQPIAKSYKKFTFQVVRALAGCFDTSLTATAIRLIEGDHSPAILVCHGLTGRKWFCRSPSVPERWFPQDQLDSDSYAFDTLFGRKAEETIPRKIGADVWFDRRGAAEYEILEQTIRIGNEEILSLLLIDDERMLDDDATQIRQWKTRR